MKSYRTSAQVSGKNSPKRPGKSHGKDMLKEIMDRCDKAMSMLEKPEK